MTTQVWSTNARVGGVVPWKHRFEFKFIYNSIQSVLTSAGVSCSNPTNINKTNREMMRMKKFTQTILATTLTTLLQGAHAADIDAGDWTLSLGGNINSNYAMTMCDSGDLDAGGATLAGLACAGAVDENGEATDVSSVSNGLLPASLNFGAKTTQEGFDIGANINVYYGLTSSNGAGADALKFSSVDARQVFMTLGNSKLGTFKMGRDFGLFGFDAIIGDMTLLGGGANFVASDPGHTTLGGLGYGYVYTDRLSQINWTSPDKGGFQGTLGIFQPLDGNGANSASNVGLHGKLSYGWKGDVPGKVSATVIQQDVNTVAGTSESISGFDLFANVSIGNIGLTGYLFSGEGMSSLALGGLVFPGFDAANGTPEETDGHYVQATYTLGKSKVGLSFMGSEQKKVTEVENQKTTLGVYHNLTPSLTLMGEYSAQESTLTATDVTDKSSNLNLGAILFF